LKNVKAANGEPFVKDRIVTGFTNGEEEAVELTNVVPFLIEDTFIAQGADYRKGPDWASFVVQDGALVTGQNPASSEDVAKALITMIA
jgi:putative intracellular protease/amidase